MEYVFYGICFFNNTSFLFIFVSEILKKKTTNYVSLSFPTPPEVEDEDEFPPPPPDALGLPPKMKSLSSLEEIEVFKDFDHKIRSY